MKKRMGKFYVSTDLIEQGEFAGILAKLEFVPFSVRHMGHPPIFEYIGLSPMFELLDEGMEAPLYTLEMTQTETEEGFDLQVNVKLVNWII